MPEQKTKADGCQGQEVKSVGFLRKRLARFLLVDEGVVSLPNNPSMRAIETHKDC